MTQYTRESIEEMTSAFITSTCQLIPKSVSKLFVTDHMHGLSRFSGGVPTSYSIICGSTEELYIFPLNSCIGDVDVLRCEADGLAFSDDFPVLPTDLSGLFDTIRCLQIESYQGYPGFVLLRILGQLTYDWNNKRYESTYRPTADTTLYAELNISRCEAPAVLCGPAFKIRDDSNMGLGSDLVISIFCPQWPREARNWPIRPRKYGWPTIGVISEVVQNGCHVVCAQHPSCKEDKFQWRFSFSFAEVILLQSWSQTQQIIYHLLRYLAKSVLIKKDCPKKDEVLCNYHLKTLMLWTCEQMPPEWWSSSSVIAVCSEILKKLLEWLKKKHCPNYFIPEANLFHDPSSSTILENTEKRISEFCNSIILCNWFVENYILPAIQRFFEVEVIPHFVDYLLPLLEFRKALVLDSAELAFQRRFKNSYKICRPAIKSGCSAGLSHIPPPSYSNVKGLELMPVLENELPFMYFDNVLLILHFAHAFSCDEIYLDNCMFVELIKKVLCNLKL